MASIRWLHLTDLHVGMSGMSPLWPALGAELQADLRLLHDLVGGFDVVLFSGDLVQSGKDAEYKKLTDLLTGLWAQLAKLGSTPVLLAVPGNHDLVRPNETIPAVRSLLTWCDDPDLRDKIFWDDHKAKKYRAVVEGAFAGYVRWMKSWREAHPLPPWIDLNENGVLPGELAATIAKDGLALGVVGLNSSFLHLTGKVGRGQIALHPTQLHRLCAGDPNAWTAKHHVCWLMTHHPPDWLAPDALSYYQGQILRPQWFQGHICGHLHEPLLAVQSYGGAPPNRLFQGTSLFGLETWDDAQGRHQSRIHGYSAGRLDLDAGGRVTLRIWPRIARQQPHAGRWSIVPDFGNFMLDERAGNSLAIDLGARAPSVPPPTPGLARTPQPPGLGYDEDWYVTRRTQEHAALSALQQSGVPVVLSAAPMCGKSTMLRRLMHKLREEDGGTVVLSVDCGAIPEAILDDHAACLREVAMLLIESFVPDTTGDQIARWVDAVWRLSLAPERRLSMLVEQHILSGTPARVVVVFDRFEWLLGRGAAVPVARALRRWLDLREDPRWSAVRLLLSAAGTSLHFSAVDDVSEFFNTALHVRLEGFRLAEMRDLARLYARAWSDDELEQLAALVDGHPFLSRLILFLEATGTPKRELLDLDRLRDRHCAVQLRQIWLRLQARDEVVAPLCALLKDPARALSADEYDRLHQAGLVRRDGAGFVVPNALLAAYFREHC